MDTENVNVESDSVSMGRDEFVKSVKQRGYVALGLVAVLLISAGAIWGENVWTALISIIVAVTELIIAATLLVRVSDRSGVRDTGNVAVQHSWLLLSVGIALLAVYPSPFFRVTQQWFVLGMATGLGWVLIGAFTLYQAVTKTGARFTI